MPLQAGDRLGPYEIVSLLGSGGMGEVYRAFDPRLGRQVAIKVLSAETANDPSLRARFEVEARAASGLNHPNIVSVYDFGNQDGLLYIVSELVNGTPLKNEKLPFRQAVEIGAQIADGLAAAHSAGIVHRDMKPDNVMVSGDSRAKILDFGLAKRTSGIADSDGTVSMTATQTRPGMILGTIGYMSPEQVKAKEVDYRTDIFSFGLVLYEMLSGKKAFPGDSAVAMLNAILTMDPPELPPDVPPGVRQIVARCIEKNPDQRFQSTRDLAFSLRAQIGAGTRSGLSTGGFTATTPPGKPWFKSIGGWIVTLAALGMGAGGAYFGLKAIQEKPVTPTYHQLTYRRGFVSGARFTNDQNTVAYSAAWSGDPAEVFTTRTDSPESKAIGRKNAHIFSVSPNGSELALGLNVQFTSIGPVAELHTAPLLGGEPSKVADSVAGAEWDTKGQRLAVVRSVGTQRQLEYPLGTVVYSTGGWISSPRFSPDGKSLAFIDHPVAGSRGGSVSVMTLPKSEPKKIGVPRQSLAGLVWRADGKEIWIAASDTGEANRVEAVSLESGTTRVVLATPGHLQLRDIAKDNSLLFTIGERFSTISGPTPTDMRYKPLEWFNGSVPRDLTADGQKLLFTERSQAAGPNQTVYLRAMNGAEPSKVGEGDAQAISADGKKALAIVQTPQPTVLLYSLDGGQPVKFSSFGSMRAAALHPDGEQFLVELDTGKGSSIWKRQAGSEQLATFLEGASLTGKAYSPDGTLVIATGQDGKLAQFPIAGGAARPILGVLTDDRFLRWDVTGKLIYVYNPFRIPVKIEKVDVASGKRETLREIAITDPAGVSHVEAVLTPDGNTIVLGVQREFSNLQIVHGLK